MQSRNRLLDDLAKVAGSAAGVAAGLKDEVEGRLRQQFERVLETTEVDAYREYVGARRGPLGAGRPPGRPNRQAGSRSQTP